MFSYSADMLLPLIPKSNSVPLCLCGRRAPSKIENPSTFFHICRFDWHTTGLNFWSVMVKTKLRKPVRPATAKPRRRSRHSLGGLFVTALDITGEQASEILRRMMMIRHFEEQIAKLNARQKNPASNDSGACHFEAVAAAGCSVLEPHDHLVTSQRPYDFILARIGDAAKAAAVCAVGSSRVDLQACKLEYSIVSPK